MDGPTFLLRARVVVPVTRPPIEGGAVLVSAGKVAEVGLWPDLASRHPGFPVQDLGEVALLPGLINAHCHLDYTGMAAGIPPQKTFADWIKAILAHKATWSYTDFAASWMAGAAMLLRNGTTTVLDTEAVPELLPEVWAATPLRVISAIEMTGIRSGREPEEIVAAVVTAFPRPPDDRKLPALSPHSLYSTRPGLMRLASTAAAERNWLLTTHVAESQEEFDMFVRRTGCLHDWLAGQRDLSDCDGLSPVACLERLGVLSSRLIAVHVNCLGEGDAARLAAHATHVVHCPRSHDYFHHPVFPLEELSKAGVNISLGTDSLASVRGVHRDEIELNLFKELQAMTRQFPALEPDRLLRMVTINGARAIGQAGELGEIAPGADADLIAIAWSGSAEGVMEAIVHNERPVVASFIHGKRFV